MRKIIFVLLTLFVTTAHASDAKTWAGAIRVWTSEICKTETTCDPIPKPITPKLEVNIVLPEKSEPGRHILARENYVSGVWTVSILVIRVNPPDKSESYLITQSSLHSLTTGLIAQCSRYDGVNAFDFLPPGACSGVMDGKLFGASFFSPLAH